MKYKYVMEKVNYEDFASGHVLYSAPGMTSFPVRLASEIYQRCLSFLKQMGINEPYSLYDPCCGGAYMLTVIGFLHGETIIKIYASDINENAIDIARKNLSLLNQTDFHKRIEEIEHLYHLYEKESHLDALGSASRLKSIIEKKQIKIEAQCFEADVSSALISQFPNPHEINIIMTDVPYGNVVHWQGDHSTRTILDNIYTLVNKQSVVAIVADKGQKISHDLYKRLDYFKIGKRHAAILTPE